jgi:hypothetical protein
MFEIGGDFAGEPLNYLIFNGFFAEGPFGFRR